MKVKCQIIVDAQKEALLNWPAKLQTELIGDKDELGLFMDLKV